MISIEEVKQFLRIDGPEEDGQLGLMLSAAQAYVTGAVGDGVDFENPKVKLVMLMYIADLYENRSMYGKAGYAQSIATMLTQIQLEMQ